MSAGSLWRPAVSQKGVFNLAFDDHFLWGGATAANQYEGGYRDGGKGLSTADVMTAGAYDKPRRVTWKNSTTGETGGTPMQFQKGRSRQYYPGNITLATLPPTFITITRKTSS